MRAMRLSSSTRARLLFVISVSPALLVGCDDLEPVQNGGAAGTGGTQSAAGRGGAGGDGTGGASGTGTGGAGNGGTAGKGGAAGSAGKAGAGGTAGKAGSGGASGNGGAAGKAGAAGAAGKAGSAGAAGSAGKAGASGAAGQGGTGGAGGSASLGLGDAGPAAGIGSLEATDDVVNVVAADDFALGVYATSDAAVLDLRDAKTPVIIGTMTLGKKVVAAAYESEHKLAFLAAEDGTIAAFSLLHPEAPTKVSEVNAGATGTVKGLVRSGKRLFVLVGQSLVPLTTASALGTATLSAETSIDLGSDGAALSEGGGRIFVARGGGVVDAFSLPVTGAVTKVGTHTLEGEVRALVAHGTTFFASVAGKGLRAVDLGGATGTAVWSNDEANDVSALRIFGRLLVLSLDRQWISTLDISRPNAPRAVTTNKNTTPNWIGSVAGNLLFGVGKKIDIAAVPPFVTASLPAAIAGAVPLVGRIPVTFSKPIDPATLTTSPGQLLCGNQMIALTATASIDRLRVVFRAAAKLPASTTCSLSLGDLRDAFGTALSTAGSGPAVTFVTAPSEPAPLTIPKSAFPHTADGTFSSWNGATPPAQFEYFDVPSAKGMYSFFYADFDGERLWLLNDWAHGGAAIEPDCYNQFKVTTGNGQEHWDIRSYGDQRIEIRKNGTLLDASSNDVVGGYSFGASPNEATPHTQYEIGIKAAPGPWGVALHDPGPTFNCHTLELDPTTMTGQTTAGGGNTVSTANDPAVPTKAALTSPENDTAGFPVEGAFTWTAGDTWQTLPGYRVEIGTGAFSSRPFFTTLWWDTSFRAPKGLLRGDTNYWWRVVSFNANGESPAAFGTFRTEVVNGQGGAGGAAGASGGGGAGNGGAGGSGSVNGPVCEGINDTGTAIDSNTGDRFIAFAYDPSSDRVVSGVDFFTSKSGDTANSLAIYTDVNGSPGAPIVPAASFSPTGPANWYGGALSSPVSVKAGTRYWIVWRPASSQQTPFAATGTKITYTGSQDGVTFESKFTANVMMRIRCDESGAGGAGGASGSGGAAGSGSGGAPVAGCQSYPCTGTTISPQGNTEPRGVWADASGVYWTDRGTSTIRRANLDGSGAADFVDNLPSLGNLFGDDTYLYAPQLSGTGIVHRIDKTTTTADVLVTIPNVSLHGIDFFDGAFWLPEVSLNGPSSLYKFVPGQANASNFTDGQRARVHAIVHDATKAYFVSQGDSGAGSGGLIQSTPRPLSELLPKTAGAGELAYPIGAQIAGNFLYFAEANTGRVLRTQLGSTVASAVATCATGGTYGVSVFNNVLYYTCIDAKTVHAVALP